MFVNLLFLGKNYPGMQSPKRPRLNELASIDIPSPVSQGEVDIIKNADAFPSDSEESNIIPSSPSNQILKIRSCQAIDQSGGLTDASVRDTVSDENYGVNESLARDTPSSGSLTVAKTPDSSNSSTTAKTLVNSNTPEMEKIATISNSAIITNTAVIFNASTITQSLTKTDNQVVAKASIVADTTVTANNLTDATSSASSNTPTNTNTSTIASTPSISNAVSTNLNTNTTLNAQTSNPTTNAVTVQNAEAQTSGLTAVSSNENTPAQPPPLLKESFTVPQGGRSYTRYSCFFFLAPHLCRNIFRNLRDFDLRQLCLGLKLIASSEDLIDSVMISMLVNYFTKLRTD